MEREVIFIAKITRLFSEEEQSQQAIVQNIEDLLVAAKNGEIKNLMVAARYEDGRVITGYCNADIGERQTLVGHVQNDIMLQIVEMNFIE